MKLRLVSTLFLSAFALLVLSGNKNGRASFSNAGNTGAPGDQANPNGTPRTCNYCHTGSAITSTTVVSVRDSAGNAVSQYVPGQVYTARVKINATGANLKGYGFQMIALRDQGNTDLDGFSDLNPNNYKIATTTPNQRTYAEHDQISDSSYFDVRWTAPVAGTGAVTFYAAGNGVNKNTFDTGDGASWASLHLTESVASATGEVVRAIAELQVTPNPLAKSGVLRVSLQQGGRYRLSAVDLQGRVVWEESRELPAGESSVDIFTRDWPAGVYVIGLSDGAARAGVKVLKQ